MQLGPSRIDAQESAPGEIIPGSPASGPGFMISRRPAARNRRCRPAYLGQPVFKCRPFAAGTRRRLMGHVSWLRKRQWYLTPFILVPDTFYLLFAPVGLDIGRHLWYHVALLINRPQRFTHVGGRAANCSSHSYAPRSERPPDREVPCSTPDATRSLGYFSSVRTGIGAEQGIHDHLNADMPRH